MDGSASTPLIETRGAFNTIFWCVVALIAFFFLVKPLLDKGIAATGLAAKTKPAEPTPQA